jgi:uncharacterized protein (DUF2147 family)
MRKATLFAALALLVFAVPAMATSFWSESFSYANGNLALAPSVSGGNWANHSGSTGIDIQVTSGVAVGSMTNTPDDNRAFPAQSATARTYACFGVMIPQPASAPVLNYFAHFKDSGTFNFGGRVYVAPSGNTFTFGLSVGSCGTGCTVALWPSALNYGQWYTVAVMYDAAAGSAQMWVDPSSESSPSITSNTWSGTTNQAGFQLSAFALRQSSSGIPSGTSNWGYNVDNIQVGTTFGDLCPSPTPANATTWGRLKAIYR